MTSNEFTDFAASHALGKDCRPAEARLAAEAAAARACIACRSVLPLGPRPAFQISVQARILIVGQAPGTKVHLSGRPFTDASGDRLREWLGVDAATFYDPAQFAILPAGLCYPGRDPKGGDRPPTPVCGPLWHGRLRPLLAGVCLTVLVGRYGQKLYLGPRAGRTVSDTVENWRAYGPDLLPTPHPSWRSTGWMRQRPWFEADVLPSLRARVGELLSG